MSSEGWRSAVLGLQNSIMEALIRSCLRSWEGLWSVRGRQVLPKNWEIALPVSEGQGGVPRGSYIYHKNCQTEHLDQRIYYGSWVMAIRIYSSVSSLWKLCSKHTLFHICPHWSKDSCVSLGLNSLVPLFLCCKYDQRVFVFTGCGYYLGGKAVGGANMARACCSCRQHYGPGPTPSPCRQPLSPSVSASLQKHHEIDEMGLSEATLTLPNPWPASDLAERSWGIQTQPGRKHARRKQCEAVKDCHEWCDLQRKEKVRLCFEIKFDTENQYSHLLVLNPWKGLGIPVSITVATHPLSSLIRSPFPHTWESKTTKSSYWIMFSTVLTTDVSTHSRNYYIYLFLMYIYEV